MNNNNAIVIVIKVVVVAVDFVDKRRYYEGAVGKSVGGHTFKMLSMDFSMAPRLSI